MPPEARVYHAVQEDDCWEWNSCRARLEQERYRKMSQDALEAWNTWMWDQAQHQKEVAQAAAGDAGTPSAAGLRSPVG